MAKQKEVAADMKESTAAVPSREPSLAEVKPSTVSLKKGKLPPKNKSRLPRRQKKTQHETAG